MLYLQATTTGPHADLFKDQNFQKFISKLAFWAMNEWINIALIALLLFLEGK